MTYFHHGVRAIWYDDHSTPVELGEKFLGTAESLRPLDPAMNDWRLLDSGRDEPKELKLADVRGKIGDWAAHNISYDGRSPWRAADGYALLGWSSLVYSETTTPDTVQLSVTAGRADVNAANFNVGTIQAPADEALLTYPIFRGALDALASNWPCVYATAYALDMEMRPTPVIRSHADLMRVAAEPDPPPPLFLRWIAYLSAPLVEGFSPPADMVSERTPGGGLILCATPDFFDPENPDHRRRALRLTAIIDALVPAVQINGRPDVGPPMRAGPY